MNNEEMKKKSFRKWIWVPFVAIGLCAIMAITYALYASTGSGNGTITVAKWQIKFNDTDPVATSSFNITFIESATNANVVNGKVAPGSEMYASFEIDPTGTEVSVDYSFELGNITASSGSVPTGFSVSKVCRIVDSAETELIATGGKYGGSITLTNRAALTASDKVAFKVYVKWESAGDNNANHTSVGAAAPTLTIPVNCTASQKVA